MFILKLDSLLGEIWRNESPKDTEVAADERRTSLFIFGRKMADNDNAVVVYQAHQPVKQPTSEVLVDALPYIDQGYDDSGVREAASSMVEEETRRYRPTKNYLDHLATANFSQFETEIMKSEFERLQARLPMDMLSMKRYELPQPPAGKMTDIAAWSECVDNSMAQLEHQATRIANLELMADYGCEAWKSYLSLLLSLANRAQKQLLELKKQIQEVNWHRKNDQTAAGDKLGSLETNWVALVSKNYELEIACAELEKKIQMLHHHQAEMRVQAAPAPSTA